MNHNLESESIAGISACVVKTPQDDLQVNASNHNIHFYTDIIKTLKSFDFFMNCKNTDILPPSHS